MIKSIPRVLLAFACVLAVSGCATMKGSGSSGDAKTLEQVLQGDADRQSLPSAIKENGDIVVRGVKLKNTKFDYPITINSRVEYWIDYFTGKGRPHFARYLERSEFFIPYITPLLTQNNMPEDLVYLAMIESGFNNLARSHARAVGPWQFISATGKRYGLSVNWWIDERRDIRKSTLGAVEYLRDLYNMFQSWELAAAAYNAGEAKIARAIQRYGTRDFWVLIRHRFLRPETRDYVPKIIAAALLAKNREQFGFPKSGLHPGADEAVSAAGEIVKVIKTDKPLDDVKPNPEPDKDEAPPKELTENGEKQAAVDADDEDDFDDDDDSPSQPGPMTVPATLTVPVEPTAPEGQLAKKDEPQQPLAKPVPTPHVSKKGEVGGEELSEFEVQSPADLLKIARAAGLSYQTVKALNPELLRWCTPPGTRTYRLKLPVSVKEKFLTTYNHVAFPRKVQFLAYKVRPGETVQHVARHFGIKSDPIADLNGVSSKSPLRAGATVYLPLPNDRSRSVASLDVRDPPERRRHRRVKHRRKHVHKIKYKQRESARSGPRHRASDT